MDTRRSEDLDIWALFRTIWSGRWLLAAIIAAFTLVGGAYAVFAQKWYKASVVLAPTSQQPSAGGALAGLGLGGLASLTGISVPGGGDQQAVAVLRSMDFARDFILEQKLSAELLKDEPQGADIRDAVRVFDRRVRLVTENAKTRLVTLSMRWKDPDTAASWANAFARRLNERLRDQASTEAERNIAYLRKEMAATNLVPMQQSIGSMLETQMQKFMLARGNEEYAFKLIDQAVPPKQLDAPRRLVILVVSSLAGVFLSVFVVLLRDAIRNRPRQ